MQQQILQVTSKARKAIYDLMKQKPTNEIGIRVSVKSGGCSGYSYTIEYAKNISTLDEVIELNDHTKLIIDKKAILFLIGAEMDYITETFKSGFIFNNPKEKAKCGCGKSFSM